MRFLFRAKRGENFLIEKKVCVVNFGFQIFQLKANSSKGGAGNACEPEAEQVDRDFSTEGKFQQTWAGNTCPTQRELASRGEPT